MRYYLDPAFLSITTDAGRRRQYSDIFVLLNNFFSEIQTLEQNQNRRILDLMFTNDLENILRKYNPLKNYPKLRKQYEIRFNKFFFRSLRPRFIYCPDGEFCEIKRDTEQKIKKVPVIRNHNVPDEILDYWRTQLSYCAECGDLSDCILFTLTDNCSIENDPENFFEMKIPCEKWQIAFFLLDFFPDGNTGPTKQESQLRSAIEFCHKSSQVNDEVGEPESFEYSFSEKFWASLKKSDIYTANERIKEQFLHTMTEVIYSKGRRSRYYSNKLRTHPYSKKGHDIHYIEKDGKRYPKMSIDIFKKEKIDGKYISPRIIYCHVNADSEDKYLFFDEYIASRH